MDNTLPPLAVAVIKYMEMTYGNPCTPSYAKPPPLPLKQLIHEATLGLIVYAMMKNKGNILHCSNRTGVTRMTISKYISKYSQQVKDACSFSRIEEFRKTHNIAEKDV